MTIKGTLETFHLLDLLQMLAFNQKVGTLVLETAKGPRTVYVDSGTFGFVRTDTLTSLALARVLRRTNGVPADRLDRGVSIAANAGRFLGDALVELGVLDDETRTNAWNESFRELFFDLLQTEISKFEFYEQKVLAPDGSPSTPIEPLFAVDAALLEVTRQGDEWTSLRREIPSDDEVYERTSLPAEADGVEGIPEWLPGRVLPLLDGRRSISGIVDKSDCDRFSVVKYAAALLREGAIRPMTTDRIVARAEDAVSHGAPAEAVPLLRRALERGDAHPSVRVRYADALAASGDVRAGAAELDTYAASFEAADPVGVFDALQRAMQWREGDASTAARLCDHYLRHANALRSRAHDAVDALRVLVRSAAASGRAAEAAPRLAAFIERGDVPGEERLVLADLFASAGRPVEAAQTLARRAEDLVQAGKLAPAQDLLRRALGFDPTRIDVKRRLADLEGADRRRRHRRRVVLLGLLLGVVVGSAGAVYLVSDGKAARSVDDAVGRASVLARDAEAKLKAALDAFGAAVARAERGEGPDGSLAAAAATLEGEANRISTALRASLASASGEVNRHATTNRGDAGIERMKALESVAIAMPSRAADAIRAVDARAQRALEAGEKAFETGAFREADPRLREAILFSFHDPARITRARRHLAQVEDYVAKFRAARAPFDEAVTAGNTDRAWALGVGILRDLLDSDLSRELLLPVPVVTTPPGAVVRLGVNGPPVTTPTTIGYSPFGELDLYVRMPGHVTATVSLPSYRTLREEALAEHVKPVRPTLDLPEGPRWTAAALADGVGPFVAGEALWVASSDARRLLAVRARDGETQEVRGVAPFQDRVRLAGRTLAKPGGTWAILGRRTFAFLPDGGAAWQFPTMAPLDRPPAFAANGTIAIVDEAGTVYGFDAKGTSLWKATLAAPCAQRLHVVGGEFVTSTATGEVVAVASNDGGVRSLVAATGGHPVLAMPFDDGALLVVGGAAPRIVRRAADGRTTVLGEATADPSARPALAAEGLAWLDADGRVRAIASGGAKPVVLEALSTCTFPPALADGVVYAIGKDGVLRCARLDAPKQTLWTCRLEGTPRAGPEVLRDAVYVRTSVGLAAFDR